MASWSRDDDDDYMSDKVLSKCKDTRPGLVPAHVARQHRQEQKVKMWNQMNRIKPRKVLEAEQREQGMGNALDSTNKGFAMLQKMGYKPGMGVGKSASGRSEPIAINLRVGRTGLGHDTEETRKRNAATAMRKAQAVKRQKMAEKKQEKFLSKQSEQFFEKLATGDLYKSQRVCEQLDSQKGIKEPAEPFFWPKNLLPIKDEKDAKKRSTFYDDDNDDEPWERKEDEGLDEDDDDEDEQGDQEEDVDDLLSPAEKLSILTLYLRNTHLYCVWCGTTFSDKQDMKDNCPGSTAEAHND